MDFDVTYLGPAQIILEVVVGGSKVNVKMPILLTDFDIKGFRLQRGKLTLNRQNAF